MPTTGIQGTVVLDRAQASFAAGDQPVHATMRELVGDLAELRKASAGPDWQEFCHDVAPRHPLRAVLHRDPLTRRCFDKPRGYA
nr:hypothetical protein [Micromonospora sp. DSM 115978]